MHISSMHKRNDASPDQALSPLNPPTQAGPMGLDLSVLASTLSPGLYVRASRALRAFAAATAQGNPDAAVSATTEMIACVAAIAEELSRTLDQGKAAGADLTKIVPALASDRRTRHLVGKVVVGLASGNTAQVKEALPSGRDVLALDAVAKALGNPRRIGR